MAVRNCRACGVTVSECGGSMATSERDEPFMPTETAKGLKQGDQIKSKLIQTASSLNSL
jgi:hypothetical protein